MGSKWIEKFTGSFDDKARYREYKARVKALPAPYRTALEAVGRYLMYAGGVIDSATNMQMLGDLADLFEQAAADGTPVRSVVGEDPVAFVEEFVSSYAGRHWIDKERQRLSETITAVDAMQSR